jgi:HEAT repeats
MHPEGATRSFVRLETKLAIAADIVNQATGSRRLNVVEYVHCRSPERSFLEGGAMTLLMLLLLAADPTGRFDKSGNRLEDVRAAVNVTPEQEAACRTIAEWEKMATTARSKQRRTEGAQAVLRLCLTNHKTPLTEAEMAAAQDVILRLLAAQDVEVRRDAAQTLGRLGFASSAPALRECAGKDEDVLVRATCYKSLGLLKDEASVELLAKAVAKEGPTPAFHAVGALGAIGTLEARAALEELAKQKLQEDILEAVNKALDDLELGK